MDIFFYGLFMDKALLEKQGLNAGKLRKAKLPGYRLIIEQRATLIVDRGATSYGVLAFMPPDDVLALYSSPSVSDYQPESVTVKLVDGTEALAICYNLPGEKVQLGSNPEYANKLHQLAVALKFPESYLEEILAAADNTARLDEN